MISVIRLRKYAFCAIMTALALSTTTVHAQSRWWNPKFWVKPSKPQTSLRSSPQIASRISLAELEREIGARVRRVPEFQFIFDWAQKNGVQVWLFGGTAAAFAHYVHWDLLREKGDDRFNPSIFDYNYTNIFRSNQDLDIVIDGPSDKAHELQKLLSERFPYLQGDKSAWEVRLLRENYGTKEALLGNGDFLNQHTDSNSVGMVSITPTEDGVAVRDLRDWNNRTDPAFLKDIHDFTLHYYWNPKHGSTSRAKEGMNPPILSVVRYLIKAFQYELSIPEESLAYLEREIRDFNSSKKFSNSYVDGWLEKNVPKLIQNAVNIEYAWDTLEALGLRKKLIDRSNPAAVGSMGWWLSKEPLRTSKVGQGFGKTARELGITVVAHETGSYEAWESITRAHNGDPNVLISRKDTPGEAAAFGEGFYTAIGTHGAAGTNITITFAVDPDAREGRDFIIPKEAPGYAIFLNKAALRVIPETYQYDLLKYLEMIGGGFILDEKNKGAINRLNRRIEFSVQQFGENDLSALGELVRRLSKNENPFGFKTMMQEIHRLLGDEVMRKLIPHSIEIPLARFPEFYREWMLEYHSESRERFNEYFVNFIEHGDADESVYWQRTEVFSRTRKLGLDDATIDAWLRKGNPSPKSFLVFMTLYRVASPSQRSRLLLAAPEPIRTQFTDYAGNRFYHHLYDQLWQWLNTTLEDVLWFWPPQASSKKIIYNTRPPSIHTALEINLENAKKLVTLETCGNTVRSIFKEYFETLVDSYAEASVDPIVHDICDQMVRDVTKKDCFSKPRYSYRGRDKYHFPGDIDLLYPGNTADALLARPYRYREGYPEAHQVNAFQLKDDWGPASVAHWVNRYVIPKETSLHVSPRKSCADQLK